MKFSNKWLKSYRFLACALITLLFMAHTAHWLHIPTLQRMENILYDLRLRTTAVNTVDPRIVIIDIDEESLSKEGRWPWRRDKLAYLVDILFDYYNVKLLGFDVVFSEPDTSAGVELLEKLASGPLQKDADFLSTLETMRPQLSYDDMFAKSLENRPVVLGYFTSHITEKTPEVGLLPPPVAAVDKHPFSPLLFKEKSYAANLPKLQTAALSGGFFNNPNVDEDGVYRRLPLLINYNHQVYEALSLALFRTLLGKPEVKFITGEGYGKSNIDSHLEGIEIEGFHIPVDQSGTLLVPYRGRQGSFPYVSATDVLNGVTDVEKLKDKIVIVGTSAAGLLDLRVTPVQNVYAGVEVHANILSGLLDQTIKSRSSYILAVELAELLSICLLAVFIFPRLPVFLSAIIFSALLIGGIAFNFYCWAIWNIDTVLASPITLLALLYGIQLFFGFFFESRKKKQMGNMFGQYIPPELVEQMSQSDEEFSLKGESREMTVLFSDVRGFTTISEGMEPQELCELINDILTPVTRVIHESKGTIDKYIGDAIMAFWGAPMHNPQHAAYAVRAGLAILQALTTIQKDFKAKGWPEIDIGIGINTGKMSVGNMGSQFRIAYTVMGDAVNLGSRLEGLTKQYGVRMIVSESTLLAAPEFTYRELDKVRVKGKHKPITIYEPLGVTAGISHEQLQILDLLNQGLHGYRQQQWAAAQTIFEQLAERYPQDKLYPIYLERIAYYLESPPEIDWDGAFTHTRK
ncbi:CHASE2 domain-containing protein [Methylobacter sp.]|uniref:CHASE2 domain-containing protein n=1 Tax=Methylobacter sp. TaxID=2051955 RepID=UPI0024894BD2|nr:adenylate/guanylate cyclase domain-containing protein [Methylobacter sp.]MDI1277208.1 adenylate/guanylate cyclase domain-containing protein [Methylobacter sp.]MDI1357802.1 adenylate/guanylate cyclase domain-containing protein [Methylobacter sp.]